MKHFLTLFAICLFTVSVHCQIEWAKTGTRWVFHGYSFAFEVTSPMTSIGDTIIEGNNCKILLTPEFPPLYDESIDFTYEDNGEVYFYHKQKGAFELRYNFTKNVGEQWKIPYNYPDYDTLTFVVDSISFFTYGNQQLKVQHVRTLPIDCGETIQDRIISGIGGVKYFNPYVSCLQINSYSLLSCFRLSGEPAIVVSDENLNCDSLTTAAKESLNISNSLKIYPNPSTTETTLTYHLPPNLKAEIRIFNALGSQLAEYPTVQAEGTLTLPDYPAGVYFVSLFSEGQLLRTERLLMH